MLGNRPPYNKQFCTFFVGRNGVAGDVEYSTRQQPLKLFSTFWLTMITAESYARHTKFGTYIGHKCTNAFGMKSQTWDGVIFWGYIQ
jgi:hypothetical protein